MKTKNSAFNRLFTVLVFLFLYAPILVLIVFSFNEGNSNTVWSGFSLNWYKELFNDRLIMRSVYTTLMVSLLLTSQVSMVLQATLSTHTLQTRQVSLSLLRMRL